MIESKEDPIETLEENPKEGHKQEEEVEEPHVEESKKEESIAQSFVYLKPTA